MPKSAPWLFVGLVVLLSSAVGAVSPTAPLVTAPDSYLRQAPNLRPQVLRLALQAYAEAARDGIVQRPRLTIVDYELPSFEKRLWVLDLATGKVLFNEWVAHGSGNPRGSGGNLRHAVSFSNQVGSLKSSLGAFVTAETYRGKHGYSLRLDGLEPGVNDAARDRTVVIHGADYVSKARARSGSLGRSWGCPAVRRTVSRPLIDAIKGGSLVWTYYPEQRWLSTSRFLRDEPSALGGEQRTAALEAPPEVGTGTTAGAPEPTR